MSGSLMKMNAGDRGEDQHRHDRPEDLEARRAVQLQPIGVAGALPAPVLHDQRDQRAFDADEDDDREDGDEEVALPDAARPGR